MTSIPYSWDEYKKFVSDKKHWTCLPSPTDPRDFPFSVFKGKEELPDVVNYEKDISPRNQGRFGTCVAFASTHIKNLQEIKQGDLPNGGLSPLFIYSLCKDLDGIPDQQGTYPRIAMKVLRNKGVCCEIMLPYSQLKDHDDIPDVTEEMLKEAAKFRIKTYAKVNTIEEVKRALYEQGPVLIAAILTESFYEAGNTGWIPKPEGYILGGHALVICGYNNNKKAFRVVNSWGKDWGEKGFCWLPYEYFNYKTEDGFYDFILEAWTLVDVEWQPGNDKDKKDNKELNELIFQVGNNKYWVNGEVYEMDVEPIIHKNRTLIPVRFVAEGFSKVIEREVQIGWDGKNETATLRFV